MRSKWLALASDASATADDGLERLSACAPGSARLNVPHRSCFRSLLKPLDKPSPSNRPMGLSDWDTALLRQLYKTDVYLRNQRIDVSLHIMHDIMP